MRVACGFDHAGVELREVVFATLSELEINAIDLGTRNDEPVDYPDIARLVSESIRSQEADRGLIVCGSGAGVAIAASKFPGIRAATVHDTYTAHQCVEHDDVNVLCMGGRVIGSAYAKEIIVAFFTAQFTGDERHLRRLEKIEAIEQEFKINA